MSRGRIGRLGLLDGVGAAGAALTLLLLSTSFWYEVNDGVFSAWRFHAWLDLVVAAFCVTAAAVPVARLAPARTAPLIAGRIAATVGAVAVGMLVFRVIAGEPDLFNPSGDELDIASRGIGVFVTLFFAAATLGVVGTALRLRTRGGEIAPLRLSAGRPADWHATIAGVVLLWALAGDWYGTGYSSDSGFEALTVIDLVLLAVGVTAIVSPWIPKAVLLPFAAAGLVLVLLRTIWLPDTGSTNSTFDERLPGLWVALAATAVMTAAATASRRRST